LRLAGRDKTAVGQDDVCLEQVVNRQAVLAREVPGATAQGEPADTGRRDDAKGHGESERVGGMIDIARRAARTNANGSVSRIYAHALHQRQINHQSVVAAAQAWAIVAASANGDKQPGLPTKIHGGYHIGDVDTLSNQPPPPL